MPSREEPKRSYSKPWKTYSEQLAMLEARGLIVGDRAAAEDLLSHLNYYRFSGYCLAFEGSRHEFDSGTDFEHVRLAYEFDLRLRDLLSMALEVIEIDIRTVIAYEFGQRHGPFGHITDSCFHAKKSRRQHNGWHPRWLENLRQETRRSSDRFVKHFQLNYVEYPDLPIWVATEIMSFGTLSIMFKHMHEQDRRAVCKRYALQPFYLESWLHHLVYVRNCCAHHARVWDRVWSIKPTLPEGKAWSAASIHPNNRLFITLLIMNTLLEGCRASSGFHRQWKQDIQFLLANPPGCGEPMQKMGLPMDWRDHAKWA